MLLFFLYTQCNQLELKEFSNSRPDFAYCITICWLVNVAIGVVFPYPLLFEQMLSSMIYVCSQKNRNAEVSFLFGMRVKAVYLPWLMTGFNWFAHGNFLPYLSGILAGHVYHYFANIYPVNNPGRQPLKTPQRFADFIETLVPTNTQRAPFVRLNNQRQHLRPARSGPQTRQATFRPFSGVGHRLDD
ncbi:hypothetical protein ACOME3_002608 [Neoechinorhynchus agilis]